MKRSGFKRIPYEVALAKKIEADEKRKNRPKSQAASAGAKKSKQQSYQDEVLLGEWKFNVRCLCNYTCQYPGCDYKDEHIECHHVNPRSQRKDLIYVVANGKCLCSKHHAWVHAHPKQAVKMDLLRVRSRELAAKEGTIGEY